MIGLHAEFSLYIVFIEIIKVRTKVQTFLLFHMAKKNLIFKFIEKSSFPDISSSEYILMIFQFFEKLDRTGKNVLIVH